MPGSLNLARRPFVDVRTANAVALAAALAAVILSFVAVNTVRRYYEDSRKTRVAIDTLKEEIGRLDATAKASEGAMNRYDLRQLALSAMEVNSIARVRAFSWTRFLSRLEKTLPGQLRVLGIALGKLETSAQGSKGARAAREPQEGMDLTLSMVSADADGLQKAIRAFYASPYFDHPVPLSEDNPDKGPGDGWHISLKVTYHDAGSSR